MNGFLPCVGVDDLHVMSYNIRRRLPLGAGRPADRWSAREPRLRALLSTERPAILAAQEVMPDQAALIADALGDSHERLGEGRGSRGDGEACPVFYDRSRLELLDWRQAALSDTPERPGSRSWGNLFPRTAVHARFRDRLTGSVFRLVNTHLDPFSARSRLRSASALREACAAEPAPVILTGDLNAGPGSPPLRALLSHGTLVDAWLTAQRRGSPEYATYAGYRAPRRGTRIDWMLTSPEVHTIAIGINPAQARGGWPSDHLPVQAVLRLPRPASPTTSSPEGAR